MGFWRSPVSCQAPVENNQSLIITLRFLGAHSPDNIIMMVLQHFGPWMKIVNCTVYYLSGMIG
jgi:hypothetical protein